MRVRATCFVVVTLLSLSAVVAANPRVTFSDGLVSSTPKRAIYVDGDYLAAYGPPDGTKQRPFRTIQQAIDQARSALSINEIHVDRSARAYVGPVTIDRSDLSLLGDNWFELGETLPVISRSLEPTGPTLEITAGQTNVLVQGLRVEMGVMTGGAARGTAIRVVGDCADITLRNLFVTGANPYAERLTRGILVKSSSRVTIEHCLFAEIDHLNAEDLKYIRLIIIEDSFDVTVQHCEFTRIGEITDVFSIVHLFKGIELIGGSGHIVRNNLFHDLTFLPANPDGQGGNPAVTQSDIDMIVGRDSEYLTVVNNTVASIDATGIQTLSFAKNLHAILLIDTEYADIRNNLLVYIDWVSGGASGFFGHLQYCLGEDPCDPPGWPFVHYTAVTVDWEDDYLPDGMAGAGTFRLGTDAASDPVFVDRANGDYRLASDSRCVDAGDPGISDPDGSTSDLGCYGGPRGHLPVGRRPGSLRSKSGWR